MMASTSHSVFGIDLGTTYSCISYVDEHGRPAIIPNRANEPTTPSVVLFESADHHIVGKQAKRQAQINPEETCALVKRHMGDAAWTFSAHGHDWPAPAVSGLILRALAEDAERVTEQDVREVVITVPAYFGDDRRKATKLAGEMAGLEVVDIINEPMAAAFGYGFDHTDDSSPETVLVYDLGGGTFDVTVITISGQSMTTIATDGDHELGGVNWDNEFARYVSERFLEQAPGAEDPLDDSFGRQTLLSEVEDQKHALSEREAVDLIVVHDGERAAIHVTRAEFEEMTQGLLQQTIDLTAKVIARAKEKGVERIDRILLVGGSSRMPAVSRCLDETFGLPVDLHKDPDLIVAKGAALYGRKKLIEGEVYKFLTDEGLLHEGQTAADAAPVDLATALAVVAEKAGITADAAKAMFDRAVSNVCSRAFGVAVLDTSKDPYERYVAFLCHQGDTLPVVTNETIHPIRDNQETLKIDVYEQGGSIESTRPMDNNLIISGAIRDIPPGFPESTPISVTLRMEVDGTIEVVTRHPGVSEALKLHAATGTFEDPALIAAGERLMAATQRRL